MKKNGENNKAFLIEIRDRASAEESTLVRLKELSSLADTLGYVVAHTLTLSLAKINPATLIGKGKINEIKELCISKEIDIIIFDTDINPTVQRNLEALLDTCVIDRREVIIQIFADRAATKEAKLQVKLAQNQYSMNRLSRRWINFSQQRGGVKGAKGEGEKQIELDRRQIQNEIIKIKKELIKVKQNRNIQQKNRINSEAINIALVGYTNSGKSSMLKALSNEEVFVQDKLFATLDPLTRKVRLPGGKTVLISDTVGLINNLPHFLIEAFSSTLEEARIADILIIVLDAVHPNLMGCYETTIQTLSNLGISHKPIITVLNKMDLVEEKDLFQINRLKNTCVDVLEISLKDSINIDSLYKRIEEAIESGNQTMKLRFSTKNYKEISHLKQISRISEEKYEGNDIIITAYVPFRYFSEFTKFQEE